MSQPKNKMQKNITWNTYLAFVRLWLGKSMIAGGQSVLTLFTANRSFFIHWFGHDLGFPAPLLMAFLAKVTEFVGGILVCLGLFTRVSATLIAVDMLVATLVANIDYHHIDHLFRQDALITISSFLFSCLLIMKGAGRYSLDNITFQKKYRFI